MEIKYLVEAKDILTDTSLLNKIFHENIKILSFDLDNTLAENEMPITNSTAKLLANLSKHYLLHIISGRMFTNIIKRVLTPTFTEGIEVTKPRSPYIYISSNNGACLTKIKVSSPNVKQKRIYQIAFKKQEQDIIIRTVTHLLKKQEYKIPKVFGEQIIISPSAIIITFPGTKAPVTIRQNFDPNKKYRLKFIQKLKELLPQYSMSISGRSSIDITKQNIDKAFGIRELLNHLSLTKENIVFIGDGFYEDGNDLVIAKAQISSIKVNNFKQTAEILKLITTHTINYKSNLNLV